MHPYYNFHPFLYSQKRLHTNQDNEGVRGKRTYQIYRKRFFDFFFFRSGGVPDVLLAYIGGFPAMLNMPDKLRGNTLGVFCSG